MNRYLTSVYINQANVIPADIYASPKADTVSGLLASADGHAAAALASYGTLDYAGRSGARRSCIQRRSRRCRANQDSGGTAGVAGRL